ncbi:cap-specific mRNA-methyltransferase 2 [Trichonephila clavata]|uniref:Cap-specific mRNA-methyltransferase 2 n=1 Tax=Trichonephila clavata TaxID=2740835 RepID=A0A8X6J8W8_TRICU|nr:cap-specific mRNA-methyltransferase 2 [Trichonephila clavata]
MKSEQREEWEKAMSSEIETMHNRGVWHLEKLPEAPASCGQMWVIKNFRHPEYTFRIIKYLETIAQFKAPESMEVLQVVPISALCGDYFYEHLLDLNNTYLQRKVRKLISDEKNRVKLSV